MKEFIFTFGYGQNPGIGFYTAIMAEDEMDARRLMHQAYGNRWAFCYSSREKAGVDEFNLTEIPFNPPIGG